MSERTAMRALIHKDIRIIFPLVLVGLVGSLVCNLLLFLHWQFWDTTPDSLMRVSAMLSGLMPGLFAIGAAAMLVGTEEDSGTLTWLRTLPIHWHQIAISKLCVALVAYASVWLFAAVFHWSFAHVGNVDVQRAIDATLSFQDYVAVVFFQVLLLLLGFVVSYWIRMPLAGLIALIPVFAIAAGTFSVAIEQAQIDGNGDLTPGVFAMGAAYLVLVGLAQHLLAYRRLTHPLSQQSVSAPESFTHSPYYRPPSFGDAFRPSQAASLLWQQFRQTAPASVALISISVLLMLIYLATSGNRPVRVDDTWLIAGSIGTFFFILSASWLGAITFYGDNQRRRYEFLADRGISPNQIWWTRVIPQLIACLILILSLTAIGFLVAPDRWLRFSGGWNLVSLIAVLFAFGQLVSQWIDRPLLAFLAAPAYTFVCLVPVLYFFETFHGARFVFAFTALTVPVLLFASWRLSKRWLEGGNKLVYSAHAIGYTAIAVALPCVLYAGDILVSFARRLS